MALRLPRSEPNITSASSDLVSALGDLATAAGRWLALQPAAQEVPVYAERLRRASSGTLHDAGSWAGARAGAARSAASSRATRARERGSDVASATRTQAINLALVAMLLWWVDRLLTADR